MQALRQAEKTSHNLHLRQILRLRMKKQDDPRHQARRVAVCMVYANQLAPGEIHEFADKLEVKKFDANLLAGLLKGIDENREILDQIIQRNSKDWELEKFYKTDLAILKIATWELKNKITPPKVVIDEAVELAKEFGEQESAKFVNGILSGVINDDRL